MVIFCNVIAPCLQHVDTITESSPAVTVAGFAEVDLKTVKKLMAINEFPSTRNYAPSLKTCTMRILLYSQICYFLQYNILYCIRVSRYPFKITRQLIRTMYCWDHWLEINLL